jgi:hypothetical protein
MRKKNNGQKKTKGKAKCDAKSPTQKNDADRHRDHMKEFLFESVFQVVTWVFIAIAIGALFYYKSNKDTRGFIWSTVALVCFVAVMVGIIADRHFIPRVSGASSSTSDDPAADIGGFGRPIFRDKDERLTILLGGVKRIVSRDMVANGTAGVVYLGGFEPIQLVEKNKRVVVNAFLDGDNPAVEITDNSFIVQNPFWDKNFDDSAFEVVNERGEVVFQLIYIDARTISVKGIFRKGRIVMVVDDKGFTMNPSKVVSNITKLFQYPSASNRGKRVRN